MKRTGFVYDNRYLLHETGEHPESADRLRAIAGGLENSGLLSKLVPIAAKPAKQRWIEAVHHVRYIMRFEEACMFGLPDLDHQENVICRDTYDAALLSAGGVLAAIDAMMEDRIDNGFCAVRPPGHHAETDRAMGFCYFNNVAVGARYLQKQWGVERVGIIDFDVHHGNGTQHIFEQDPTIFYYSIHEHPSFSYPGTGREFEQGVGPGQGFTLNSPVLPGRGDDEYAQLLRKEMVPAIEQFRPEVLLLSAGFDAHVSDLMSGIDLTTDGFDLVSATIMELVNGVAGGKVISVLEGGYNLEVLPLLVENHIRFLAGLR